MREDLDDSTAIDADDTGHGATRTSTRSSGASSPPKSSVDGNTVAAYDGLLEALASCDWTHAPCAARSSAPAGLTGQAKAPGASRNSMPRFIGRDPGLAPLYPLPTKRLRW